MMTRFSLSVCLMILTLGAVVATPAQAYYAPDGNTLPEGKAISPHALNLSELAPPSASADTHDHAADDAQPTMTRAQHDHFADEVNLSAFRKLAVYDTGRVKIIDTLAREQIERIYGKSTWTDAVTGRSYDPVFTYLDLIFDRAYYMNKPIIYVDVLPLRESLVADLPEDQQQKWLHWGRLSPEMFQSSHVQAVLQASNEDLRLIRGQQQVMEALASFIKTGERLAMVSPLPGGVHWAHVSKLSDTRVAAAGDSDGTSAPPVIIRASQASAPQTGETPAPPMLSGKAIVTNPEAARAVLTAFHNLAVSWRAGDAASVNKALAVLTDTIPTLNAKTYPPFWSRELEYLYNFTHKGTIGYMAYLLGALLLLLAFAVGRGWLIKTGVAVLLVGFAFHTAGIITRGILSGRWPIHNQFESFIAVSWFAVLVGIIFMLARKQWLFGAAASAVGAAALFVANTTAIPSSEPGPVAPILSTSDILYVHVNMMLCSYALIALGFFLSLFYLGVHYFRGEGAARFAAAGVGALPATATAGAGGATGDQATAKSAAPNKGIRALLLDLDKAQIVVLQLAFWLLGVGILLGAYWADYSWGRWWGWDPKETWALITWIIYLIAIHTRFGVKDRGLVTAWLSVLGFFVMLWTYWGVNILLPGLHSYA